MYPKPDSAGTSTGAMATTNPTNPFAMMSDVIYSL